MKLIRIQHLVITLLLPGWLASCALETAPVATRHTQSNTTNATRQTAHPADQTLYALPESGTGWRQSPLNLLTLTDNTQRHDVDLAAAGDRIEKVIDTGHTIEITFSEAADIHFDHNSYALQQCHFHTPSEHQIDGMTHPMEMHCVSIDTSTAGDAEPRYLVVAYLFRMGTSNPGIAAIIDSALRMRAAQQQEAVLADAGMTLDQVIGSASKPEHFFSYAGSLTTEPYTETVHWLVLTNILTASPQEIRDMNRLDGNNARHIQADNERIIELD